MKTNNICVRIIVAVLFAGLFCPDGNSQATGNEITVNVNIVPPYSSRLYKYSKLEEKFIITLNNNTTTTYNVRLQGNIESDNDLSISTKESYRPTRPIVVPPGMTTLTSSTPGFDLLDESNVDIKTDEKTRNLIIKDGIIPEGNYTFCFQVYDFNTGATLSQAYPLGCATVPISYLQPPVIMAPIDGIEVFTNLPQFSWTPITGNIGGDVIMYDLYILKLLENQNPNDAMLQAVNYNIGNPLKKTLSTTGYVYLPSDWPLEDNSTYAVQVIARSIQNQQPIENDGKSEITTFTYTSTITPTPPTPTPPQQGQSPFACNCNINLPQGNAKTNFTVDPGFTFSLGEYTVNVNAVNAQPDANGTFSGTGTVEFPLSGGNVCPVEVSFTDVQLNTGNEAIAGNATALLSPDATFIPANDPNQQLISLNTGQLQDIKNYFISHPTHLLSNSTGTTIQLPVGINNLSQGNSNVVAVTGMYFTPINASFDAVAVIDIPDATPSVAGFSRKNICFSGSSICNSEGILYLENDINLNFITNQGEMVLSGWNSALSTPADSGTYVLFDNSGIQNVRIQGSYTFPVTQIVSSDGVSPVEATIKANATSWSDWIGQLEFQSPFISANLQDFSFNISQPALFDHSDLANPQNLPAFYIASEPSANLPDWTGVYIPEGQVSFPGDGVDLTINGPVDISATGIVIDNQGVSVDIEQTNVLDITQGTVADWKFSMDNLDLQLFKNSLTHGEFAGKLLLPIANDTSYLNYTCALSINNGDLDYQFLVNPRDDYRVPMWKAKMDLEQSSVIDIQLTSGALTASANLNGKMNINGTVGQLKKLKLNGLEFQNLQLSSTSNTINIGTCSEGSSGKKKLAGFTLKIKDVQAISGTKPGVQIRSDIVLFEKSSKPLANTTFTIEGKEDNTTNRRKYIFDDAILDSIKIDGNLAVVKLKGYIVQYDDDATYGDGFKGVVTATFPPKDAVKVNSTIQFGEISSAADTFKYWYVDGMVDIKKGITLFPGIKAYGFGGGAYYHMSRGTIIPEDVTTEDPANFSNIGQSPSGVTYTPDANVGLGLKAAFIFGLAERKTFNADVRLELEFTSTGGFSRFMFDGDAKALAKNDKGEDAMIKGLINVEYDHINEVFHADIKGDVKLKAGITAEIPIQIHFDPNNWYIWAGRPTPDSSRCRLEIQNFAQFTAYFQCGTMVDPMPDVPQFIQEILTRANVPSDFLVSERNELVGSQEGMIFGGSMEFHYSGTFLIFKGSLDGGIGFDLAIRKFETDCEGQQSGDLIGVDGWYANGQLYAGIKVMLSIYINLGFYKADISIFEAGAAAVLQGGLPNPTWVQGVIAGYFEVLDGLIKGDFHYKFEHGHRCLPMPTDALESLQLIANVYPLETPQGDSNDDLEIDVFPTAISNFRINPSPFTLEQADHESGETYERVFRFTPGNIDVDLLTGNNQASASKIIDSEEFGFMIKPYEMLMPNSTYNLTITATVEERINGNWVLAEKQDGTLFEEVHEVTFTTNEGLDELGDDNVKYSVPDNRQRNFSFSDYNEGYIKLEQEIDYHHFNIPVDDTEYDIEFFAKFIPLGMENSTPIEVPLQNGTREFSFDVPTNLEPATIYCIQLLSRWTPKVVEQAPLLFAMMELQIWSFDTNVVTKTTREINMENLAIAKNEKKLFALYFRTSKYGSIVDKLDNMHTNEMVFSTQWAREDHEKYYDYDYVYMGKDDLADNATMISSIKQKLGVAPNEQIRMIYPSDVCLGGDEPFDFIDIYGYKSEYTYEAELGNTYDPLIEPRISLDVLDVSAWSSNVYNNIVDILTSGGDMAEVVIPPYNDKIGGYIFEKDMQAPVIDPLTDQEIFDGVEMIHFQHMEQPCKDRLLENTVSEPPVQNTASGMVIPSTARMAYVSGTTKSSNTSGSSTTTSTSQSMSASNAQAYSANATEQAYESYMVTEGIPDMASMIDLEPNHINLMYSYRYKPGRGLESPVNNLLLKITGAAVINPSPEMGLNIYSNVGQAYDAAQNQMGSANIMSSNVSATLGAGSVAGNNLNMGGQTFNFGF